MAIWLMIFYSFYLLIILIFCIYIYIYIYIKVYYFLFSIIFSLASFYQPVMYYVRAICSVLSIVSCIMLWCIYTLVYFICSSCMFAVSLRSSPYKYLQKIHTFRYVCAYRVNHNSLTSMFFNVSKVQNWLYSMVC